MNPCAENRHALGVYVLGAIDPVDRALVEAHLAECAACRDELAGLAGLPALLSRVTPEEVERTVEPADPGLLEPLLARVAAERRRSRLRLLVAAAAVLVLLAGVLSGVVALRDTRSAPTPRVASPSATFSATGKASQVSARVEVFPRAWGTSVSLRLSGVAPYTTCQLIAVGQDGRRDVAASWRATYSGGASVTGATALNPRDIARFDVMTHDGQRLVTVPTHARPAPTRGP